MSDLKKSNKCFNTFIRDMKKHHPDFQYFCVVEFQSDIDFFGKLKPNGGAVHYHVLCNLPYVKSQVIADIWKHGFIKIKRINKDANLGKYLSNYLQKDMADKRMFGKNKFSHSQGLQKPAELIGDNARFFMQEASENLDFVWKKKFKENVYRGKIFYKIYKYKPAVS